MSGVPCHHGGRGFIWRSTDKSIASFQACTQAGPLYPPIADVSLRRSEPRFGAESPRIARPGAPRSVREPLDSHGSRCSAVSMAQLPMSEERRICAAKPIKPVVSRSSATRMTPFVIARAPRRRRCYGARLPTVLRPASWSCIPRRSKIVYCKDANRRGDFPIISFDFLGFQFRDADGGWQHRAANVGNASGRGHTLHRALPS